MSLYRHPGISEGAAQNERHNWLHFKWPFFIHWKLKDCQTLVAVKILSIFGRLSKYLLIKLSVLISGMHRSYVLLQVDGPEEIPDPEDPSKFTSVGVQVEDNKGWETLQRKRVNTNMKNKSRKSPTQLLLVVWSGPRTKRQHQPCSLCKTHSLIQQKAKSHV